MLAIWLSLKENVNCVSRLNDIVAQPSKKRMFRSVNDSRDSLLAPQIRNPLPSVLFRHNSSRVQFCELSIEDPSRRIVEMIFQKASMDPTKPLPKVERVLRVKNPSEVLERFERHRQAVMKRADQQPEKNPRSSVDGNEMLPFYSTTAMCCNNKSKKVSEVCKIPTCKLCRIIQSKFDTESTRRNGIRLTSRSDTMIDKACRPTRGKNIKGAVVLCRIIAGRVADTVGGFYEGWDSAGRRGLNSDLEYLTVKDPCAILPCFVIVFS